MSWTAIVLLGSSSYTLKALGPLGLGIRTLRPGTDRLLALLAVPLLAALVLVQTFDAGGRLTVDARLPALAVAGLLVWRRAPFLVAVLGAAATAATLRAMT